jgi:hypothetical protein
MLSLLYLLGKTKLGDLVGNLFYCIGKGFDVIINLCSRKK